MLVVKEDDMERGAEAYEVGDLDNSCGDAGCCGDHYPIWGVFLPVRGWVGYFHEIELAERMARLCKRWGVK